MPPQKAPKNASAAAAVGGRDHISNVPDEVLQHLLSFLPAQDAVRTCVLAKRWRHMWKSTTGLRFVCGTMQRSKSMKDIQDFVDHLLHLRFSSLSSASLSSTKMNGTPLDKCQFDLRDINEDNMSHIILWIRIALNCKVRVLKLSWLMDAPGMCPQDGHFMFISHYLKNLELDCLSMPSRFLDFSYCPTLEELKIVDCYLNHALLISSQSLKRLSIVRCRFGVGCRKSICTPNLVSLWLEVEDGRIPLLQRMPSLITAHVKIDSYYGDTESEDDDTAESEDDDSAKSDDDYCNQSILLHGLSEVRNLSLKSRDDKMLIFRRDLKFCPSFNNLKFLLLNEYWCEPADFSALARLLKLCPLLEKLTLELYSWEEPKYKGKYNVEIKLNCNPWVMSAEILKHLKIVEVKCQEYDERINNVLTFLSKKLNIYGGTQMSSDDEN